MNIQSGQMRTARTAPHGTPARVWSKLWIASKVAFFCVIAAALFNANIYLRQKITETERNIRRIDRAIADTRRDLERLRADHAELTGWTYIRRRIAELKLPLRPPRPGQIIEIKSGPSDDGIRFAAGRGGAAGRVAAR